MASTKLTEPVWGIKIPPHNQDECDFMLILLSVSCFATPL